MDNNNPGAPGDTSAPENQSASVAEEKCSTCGSQASGGNCVPCGQPAMSCNCPPASPAGGVGGGTDTGTGPQGGESPTGGVPTGAV